MWERLSRFVFGEKVRAELPERVRLSIAEQQVQTERLISCVQLALIVIFIILYSISPSTSVNAPFQPVPWVLAGYLAFTLARTVCVFRSYLPNWLLVISVLMDIGLLMGLIWSFHIQYMQPASFYLKAPTVFYVFIFISLRALHYQPRFILLSGAAAIVGWAILVGYVVFAVPDDPMITRNYVVYLTSNSVLIGAEVDKMISFAMVTGVLAVAVLRSRRVLHQAIFDSTAAKDLSRFVSTEVAERITSSDRILQPGDGESRVATVVFTDIEGFSTVSEKLNPAELARTLNDYFGVMSEVIHQYGGVITQYQGDLMLITFNAVTDDQDHAANAVRTAIGIREAAANRLFGEGCLLKTRCGVNTGDISVGVVGAGDLLSFTVHGDEVNIAARLEQLNKEFGLYILVGENTAQACAGLFDFEPVTEVAVRGRQAPTKVFQPK